MQNRLRDVSGLLMVALLSGCGGGTEPGPVDNVVATVTVSGSATVAPGATKQLTAVARNAAGTTIAGLTATWQSSNENAATVSVTGLVTAVAAGTSTITATVSGKSATTQITVAVITPIPAANVEATAASQFSPSQVDITAGGTVTWAFNAVLIHNVTFSGTATGTPANIGDTSNQSVPRTFSTAGNFAYQCTIHPGMSGTVIVH